LDGIANFSKFPDGWPGIGLLVLRVALGVTLGAQGFAFFVQSQDAGPREWLFGFIALIGAASFLLGLFTSVGAMIVILGSVAAAMSLVSLSPWNVWALKLALGYIIAIAAAIILLGPGAISIDARIFGRREIIIPRRPSD
jgi:uncharacterized membrane protein YphA (DoxX/SURF4 family)